MVDTNALGAFVDRREGSNPFNGTKKVKLFFNKLLTLSDIFRILYKVD
jgi:hypothetical protein